MDFRGVTIICVTAVPVIVILSLLVGHLTRHSHLEKCKENESCIRYCCAVCDKEELDLADTLLEEMNFTRTDFKKLKGKPCEHMTAADEDYTISLDGRVKEYGHEYDWNQYCILKYEDNETFEPIMALCLDDTFTSKIRDTYKYFMLGSIPFLLLTIAIYSFVKELNNLHGKCLMSYVGSLTVMYILLSIQKFNPGSFSNFWCSTLGYLLIVSIFWCFFWLNVMCYNIWHTIECGINTEQSTKTYLKYCAYAFGVPILLVFVLFICTQLDFIPEEYRHNMGKDSCANNTNEDHSQSRMLQTMYLHAPIIVFLIINFSFYGITAWKIFRVHKDTKSIRRKTNNANSATKTRFCLYLRLSIVMGIPWIIESLSFFVGDSEVLIIASIINCMQGFIIFITFVWKAKVKNLVLRQYQRSLSRRTNQRSLRQSEVTRLNSFNFSQKNNKSVSSVETGNCSKEENKI